MIYLYGEMKIEIFMKTEQY